MKKVLISATLIILGSTAYADTILYGQLHGSVDFINTSNSSKETTISSNISRIGVKGTTDINHGLKTIFQAEWEMDTGGGDDTQDSILSNRNQIVGLSGRLGTAFIGRYDTPLKIIGRKADLFWRSQLGQNRNITRQDVDWDARLNNMIGYQLPHFGGLKVLGSYVTDREDNNDNTIFGVNGIYKNDFLTLGAAYEARSNDTIEDENSYRVMGAYKFGDTRNTKVVGFYQDEDNGQLGKAKVFGIGGSHKISTSGLIKTQYYIRDQPGKDGELLAIGYDYSLGKKTEIYTQYARTENLGGIGGAGHGERFVANARGETDGFSIGMRHKF